MSARLTFEQCKAAKRYCWKMYSNKPWFCGCVYKVDDEGHVVGVEIRTDPKYIDRFTYVPEKDGVKISVVNHDPDKHGEPYDRTKRAED